MNNSPLLASEPGIQGGPADGVFTLYRPESEASQDARFDESLLEHAAGHGPTASIWQARHGLVVPRTYRQFPGFESACERFAEQGWPITVRQTGGGIVPQGPGILNLSLAYRVEGPPMRHSEPGYVLICALLAQALQGLGIDAFPAPVGGSFCDGRYNLAVRLNGETVKIAGTAQMWRRLPGTEVGHMGLVHALILLDVDTGGVTRAANAFETEIGSERRYRADRVVSAAELLATSLGLETAFSHALAAALARTAIP